MVTIKHSDVIKTFDLPTVVDLVYHVDGVNYTAKVKASATGLVCPCCGKLASSLQASRRGLVCRICRKKQAEPVLDEVQ